MDETLHGLIQDIEGGYVHSLAFVAPGRMAWPLPLYELALMTAGRAYDMGVELAATIVTPRGQPAGDLRPRRERRRRELLAQASIQTINSAYAELPSAGELVINPGDRRLRVDRVIALPELYGPSVRGIPLGEHGFIRVDPYGQVPDVEHDLRRRRCDRVPGQARRHRLPAGRHRRTVDRRAGRRTRHTRAVPPRDPRHAAHRRASLAT